MKVNQVSVICTVTGLGNGQPRKCGSISSRGRRYFSFSKTFRLAAGLKQLQHEADHSLPSNAKIKNEPSESPHTHTHRVCVCVCIYRMSQEECARLRESVPYVKVYWYNPKHLYPKLNGYGDNDQRKVGASCGSKYCNLHSCVALQRYWPWEWNAVLIVPVWRLVACTGVGRISTSILLNIHAPCKVLGILRPTTALMRVFM